MESGEPLRTQMKYTIALLFIATMSASDFDQQEAARFAKLALDCVHQEYPNKIAHSLLSDADVKPPRELTPAFYGCYDWHSSVHGHWLLARLARMYPDAPFVAKARAALKQSLGGSGVGKGEGTRKPAQSASKTQKRSPAKRTTSKSRGKSAPKARKSA